MCDGYGRIKVHGFPKKKGTRFIIIVWYTVHVQRLDNEKVITDIVEIDS